MAFYGIKYHIRPLTYNNHRIPIVKKKPDRHSLIKLSIGEYNSYSVYPERTSQLGNLVDHIIIVFHHRLYLNIFVLFYCDSLYHFFFSILHRFSSINIPIKAKKLYQFFQLDCI